MKKKTIALILTVAMSVMSSIPVLAAQNSNSYYESNCPMCGESATIFTVIQSPERIEEIDYRLCEHDHEGELDILRVYYVRVSYYCPDCDINWEQTEYEGMVWHCTYDD